MAVENILVRERIIDQKNVSDYTLLSDAQSCALLKEYVITYLLLHAEEVLQFEDSSRLRESSELLAEMIVLQARISKGNINSQKKERGELELQISPLEEELN